MTERLTTLAQHFIRDSIAPGATVLDATMGNGHDTLFLARCVGDAGRVLALDRQADAVQSTNARLVSAGLRDRAQLIRGDHATIEQDLPQPCPPLAAIMFNLGYLPGGDKQVTTAATSTLHGIRFALGHLSPSGRMTCMAYRGHDSGPEEANAVASLLQALAYERFTVTHKKAPANGPVLWMVKRNER
ncbi:MAG: class I SAM-dependent methyltransferase [Pseudomonadota bacterium]